VYLVPSLFTALNILPALFMMRPECVVYLGSRRAGKSKKRLTGLIMPRWQSAGPCVRRTGRTHRANDESTTEIGISTRFAGRHRFVRLGRNTCLRLDLRNDVTDWTNARTSLVRSFMFLICVASSGGFNVQASRPRPLAEERPKSTRKLVGFTDSSCRMPCGRDCPFAPTPVKYRTEPS